MLNTTSRDYILYTTIKGNLGYTKSQRVVIHILNMLHKFYYYLCNVTWPYRVICCNAGQHYIDFVYVTQNIINIDSDICLFFLYSFLLSLSVLRTFTYFIYFEYFYWNKLSFVQSKNCLPRLDNNGAVCLF